MHYRTMEKRRFILLITVPVIVALAACENSTKPVVSNVRVSILDQTPKEDYEAEAAALWLSGDLVAPEEIYRTLHKAYAAVRGGFSDSIPALTRASFVAPWEPGKLLVKVSEGARAELRRGDYGDLDSLNTFYRSTRIDTSLLAAIRWMIIGFEGRLHPERLKEAYESIPSVENASPNTMWNNTRDNYPWLLDDGVTLLFREGWGDCPSGCIDNQFWYFRVTGTNVQYVGTFVRRQDPYPSWWDEAKIAYEAK